MSNIKLISRLNVLTRKSFVTYPLFSRNQISTSAFQYIQKNEQIKNEPDSSWIQIYKFPFIRGIAAINKLKVYQLGITAMAVPFSLFMEQMREFPTDTTLVVGYIGNIMFKSIRKHELITIFIGISGTFTLSIVGYLLKNMVGLVYINSNNTDIVKISYMDFWGRRRDVEKQISDIVPLSEISKSIFDQYFTKLKFYSSDKEGYKLVHRFGGIVDLDMFSKVFGCD